MPNLAQIADRLCILRAVATDDNAHSSSGYYMLTGVPHRPKQVENANPGAPNDYPSLPALVGRLAPSPAGLPGSIRLPHRIFNTDGSVWPGQDAGFLGRAADPWLLNGLPTSFSTPELNVACKEGEPHTVVEQLIKTASFAAPAKISTIDGVRVDWPDGFGLIRASNTTPVLVLRFEGHTESALQRIQSDMLSLLHSVKPDASFSASAH